MARWDYSIEAPDWLAEGARVSHATFGRGTVGRVGTYKNVPTVWIDFDAGHVKALSLEYGLPHLAPESDNDSKGRSTRSWFRRR